MDLPRGSGNANVPPHLTRGQISQNLARFSISDPGLQDNFGNMINDRISVMLIINKHNIFNHPHL